MADSKEIFTFTWKIENFSMLSHRKGEKLESPSFTVDILEKTKCSLWLYPRGDRRNESDDYVSLFLMWKGITSNLDVLNIRYSFVLEATRDFHQKVTTFKNTEFSSKVTGSGIRELVLRSDLATKKDYLLPQDVLTIKCHLWLAEKESGTPMTINVNRTDLSNAFRMGCSAITRSRVLRRNFTWSIPKVNQLVKKRKAISIITESTLEGSPSLKLSFFFSDDPNDKYAKVEILKIISERTEESLFVKCKITALTSNYAYQNLHEDSYLFSSDVEKVWRFPEFLKIEYLIENKYIIENTLFLHFEFAFSRLGLEYHLEVPMYVSSIFQPKPSSESGNLSDGIRQLFVSKKLCDVTVRAGGKSFPCHKVALCAQSSVFSAMFENDMQEKNTGIVDIEDLDPTTVERMLTFMHSDDMADALSTDDTCKLYEAADKYQILPLKWKCSLLMLSSLTVKSVCRVLEYADRHQDNFLLANVHNFVSIHASEIVHSPQWQIFMEAFPKFSGEVMLKVLKKNSFL